MTAEQAREENAYALGVQAYLWGFPLTFFAATYVAALKAGATGVNAFRKFPALKTAKDRFVVTPNNVTIDGYGAYDVTLEPSIIFVPKLERPRWYIVQLGDAFDEIFRNVGGTKGEQPGVYVITGPDFVGDVPGDMIRLTTRTKLGTVALRVFVSGEADLPNAVEAQSGFHLMPLSAYLRDGLAYKPPAAPTPPAFAGKAPQDIRFFEELGFWMGAMLAISADTSDTQVASFREIGLSVGAGFAWDKLDDPTKRGLARAVKAGESIVDARWNATGETTNGWRYAFATGRAGFDLALRAALAKYEIGAQLSDQVTYPNCRVDDHGEPLTGERKYTLQFLKGKAPPVSVFWNMAMYGEDMLFVENDFGRYSIGSTTDGLKSEADGSLTILIQNERPADTSNWLPSPKHAFNLTMRMYGPSPSVLDGTYRLPVIKPVKA
ncbi:MAG TPA: DUF1214 domain-containing protein [Verrucomicrobiae bacterium]|nr:DUF1214 domain-containing protein [Verrucomicrobiae bacterium]